MSRAEPWYRHARRWGQTNLTEIDAATYDPAFWREQWRATGVDGIIVNAGGIVSYYPSEVPYHYRAAHLHGRDLFGEIVATAREEGLAVLARMDCNRATREALDAHPEWFFRQVDGSPMETQGRYITCVNSPYYTDHIPRILREVAERYHPDGFTDNSWTGVGARTICRCDACRRAFGEATGEPLPEEPNWDDPRYRRWITWNYRCREATWDRFSRVAVESGGEHCLWLGMVGANPFESHLNFADLAQIGARTRDRILMCDHQSRDELGGFEQNTVNGLLLHGVSSPGTIIPQSMAHYVRGHQAFRRASMPPEETRTWMRTGLAGGISPWWHHVGADQEDRRQFVTSAELFRWHAGHESALYERTPLVTAGLVWSHENIDFYGRDQIDALSALPWRGWTAALTRARIPFTPVHADAIPSTPDEIPVLVLPHLAVVSDDQADALARYQAAGGTLVITGASGTMDETGATRSRWAFEALTGMMLTGRIAGLSGAASSSWEVPSGHTYLRFAERDKERAPIVRAFAGTDILPFGGTIHELVPDPTRTRVAARGSVAPDVRTHLTFVPPFPIYPPEFAWMREPVSDMRALVTIDPSSGGRIVVMPADLDRQYGRLRLPDHAELLASAVRHAAGRRAPFEVSGSGYLSCTLYRCDRSLVMHIVNLTGLNQWPGYADECVPVGPITVRVRANAGAGDRAHSLVTDTSHQIEQTDAWCVVQLEQVREHEVLVFQ